MQSSTRPDCPGEEIYIKIENKEDIWEAIYHLKVRGAPAIGVAASYGLCIEAGRFEGDSISEFIKFTKEAAAYIQSARPTAVNLSWAMKRLSMGLENAARRLLRKARNGSLRKRRLYTEKI